MGLRSQIYHLKKITLNIVHRKYLFSTKSAEIVSLDLNLSYYRKKTVVHSAFTHCVHYVESWFVRFFSIICDQNFSLFCASFDFESCLAHSWSLSEPWRENDELYDYTYAPAYRQCLLFLFCAKSQNHELYSEKKNFFYRRIGNLEVITGESRMIKG